MEPFKHWKIVLSLTSIFVAGAITGGVVTFQVVRSVVRARTNPDQWSARVLRDYRDRLELTKEQQERIRPLLMEAGREMKQTRAEFMQTHAGLMRKINAALLRELSPEQRKVFEEIREEQKHRFRERAYPSKRAFPPSTREGRGKFSGEERPYWKQNQQFKGRETGQKGVTSSPDRPGSLREPPRDQRD